MKRFLLLAVILAFPRPAAADVLGDIKARWTLVCGVLNGYEPYAFQDPKAREPIGYEVDSCKELARFLG